MTPEQETLWRKDCREAIIEFDESGALATNQVPDNLRHAYFRAGFLSACKKRAEEQQQKNEQVIRILLRICDEQVPLFSSDRLKNLHNDCRNLLEEFNK